MIDSRDKRAQVAAVLVLIVAITALRVVDSRTGPLYLVPVVMAALWLGPWPGLLTGVLTAVLTRVTIDLSGDDAADPTFWSETMRVLVYGALGYAVGALSQSRVSLERELTRRELELEELRALQNALAPSEPPTRPALELATCYIPAEQGVSGDFHVVVPAAGGATLIAVGDVAGRGLEAAKRAWYARTLLLASADITKDPSTVLERANRSLVDEVGFDTPFVTVACLLFHPDGRLEWALAGHDGPVLLDTGERLVTEQSGLPLGVSDDLGCRTSETHLAKDQGVLVYTDGLSEARRDLGNGGFDLFGEERITELVAGLGGLPATDVLERVRDEVREFSGGEFADDLCMVAMRVSGDPDATEVCAPDRIETLAASA